MVRAFSQITIAKSGDDEDVVGPRQIAIDSKARRGSKDAAGRAEHVLSAFCSAREQLVEHVSGLVAVWCRSFDSVMCSKGDEPWAQEGRMNFAKMRCGSR